MTTVVIKIPWRIIVDSLAEIPVAQTRLDLINREGAHLINRKQKILLDEGIEDTKVWGAAPRGVGVTLSDFLGQSVECRRLRAS
jgi:hypothetical protein